MVKKKKKKKGGGGRCEGKGLGSVRYRRSFVTIQVNEKPSGGEKPPTGQPNADMSMLSLSTQAGKMRACTVWRLKDLLC